MDICLLTLHTFLHKTKQVSWLQGFMSGYRGSGWIGILFQSIIHIKSIRILKIYTDFPNLYGFPNAYGYPKTIRISKMHTDLQNLYGFPKCIQISKMHTDFQNAYRFPKSIQLQIPYGFSYTNKFIDPSGWFRNFLYFISILLKRN